MILCIQDAGGAERRIWMLAPSMKHVRLVLPKIAGAGHLDASHSDNRLLKVHHDLVESFRLAADDCGLYDIVMESEAYILEGYAIHRDTFPL